MGCVDSRSRAAAKDSSSAESVPEDGSGRMSVTAGRPTVRVPVLSKTTLSTLDAASRMSPPLISRPLQHQDIVYLSRSTHMRLFNFAKHSEKGARMGLFKQRYGRTPAGSLGSAHEDGSGSSKAERTGAGHHQHVARQLRCQQERCCLAARTCPMPGYHLLR